MITPNRKNVNLSRLPKDLMADLYERIILRWELDVKVSENGFDIRDKQLKAFLSDNKIYLQAYDNQTEYSSNQDITLKEEVNDYLYFVNIESSQPKSILRHLRNAVAHAHVQKVKNQLLLNAFNIKKQEVMRGKLKQKIFISFVDALVTSSRPKKSKIALNDEAQAM